MNFEKLRPRCKTARLGDHRIEALHVTHLKNAAVELGCVDERLSLLRCGSDRFFNEHVDSMLEQVYADAPVISGRNGEADCIHLTEELPIIAERIRAVQCGDFFRALLLNIDDTGKLHTLRLRVQTRMMPAEMSDSDYSDFHEAYSTATIAISAASASRIRLSRSIINVLRASIASAETFRRAINFTVASPITGTSKRKS